jgi:HAD domain in Swiss Army Knife RNA repair proteins
MKVIFLDIDGVLNCKSTPNPRKFPYIVDLGLLERFKGLIDRAGAQVVLLSTWRHDPAGLFSAKHLGVPFADVIPDMPECPRRDEVLAWLADHPEVTRFAIIDDQDDELDELPVFQPSSKTGITDEIVRGAAAYLNGETDKTMRASWLLRKCQNVRSFFIRDIS